MKLQFLDKRDQEGKILQYEALELNFKLTKNIFKIFKKKSIYCKLIKIFPEKYVQFYFEKYFFELFTEISNQYTIYKHDEKTLKNEDLKKLLDLNKTELFILLSLVIPVIFFGIYPEPLINTIEVSVNNLIDFYNTNLLINK